MNTRIIKLFACTNLLEFKNQLLHALHLHNANENTEVVFHTKVINYCTRNKNLFIEVLVSKTSICTALQKNFFDELTQSPIPETYPVDASNMEKQMHYNPIPNDKYEHAKEMSKEMADKEWSAFSNHIVLLNQIENLKVTLIDNINSH